MLLVPLRHKLFSVPLYLFLILYVYKNYINQRWLIFAGFALTIFMSDTISSKIIKPSIQRTRPCHEVELQANKRIPCSHGFSFTSSHATNHFAIGTFLFLLFAWTVWRYGFMLWAGSISFAQIYVGVHYPLDVICGSTIGILIGVFTFAVFNNLSKRYYTEIA